MYLSPIIKVLAGFKPQDSKYFLIYSLGLPSTNAFLSEHVSTALTNVPEPGTIIELDFGNRSSVFVATNKQSSEARYEAAFMNFG